MRSFEEALAFHCAPALAGLKPANLICCDREQYPALDRDLDLMNRQLGYKGIHLRPLCRCKGRELLLVYREALLARHLETAAVQAFLEKEGYPVDSLEAVLSHLQERLAQERDFPHEMGVILGYPVADVEGFLKNNGKNCKFSGYWKVYHNETETRALFAKFTRCRYSMCRLVANGMSIAQLLRAA